MKLALKKDIVTNIENFNRALRGRNGKPLIDLLGRFRAWYGVKKDEEWFFGPSKFIGYEGMDAKIYVESNTESMDGRETEANLREWFPETSQSDPRWEEAYDALREFLHKFGKKPSRKMRISLISTLTIRDREGPLVPSLERVVVDSILRLAQSLPKQEVQNLRRRFSSIDGI